MNDWGYACVAKLLAAAIAEAATRRSLRVGPLGAAEIAPRSALRAAAE